MSMMSGAGRFRGKMKATESSLLFADVICFKDFAKIVPFMSYITHQLSS